jgi:acyl-coenzyme A thioesterase PaaI-like protein
MTSDAPPTSEFDQATAVRPAGAPDTYAFDVDAGFTVGPKPNGGYLLATVARAAGLALGDAGSDHRDALAATAHYLWAPDPGPATIEVEVLRTGRGASQARATIRQDDRRCVDVTLTMGTLTPGEPTTWSSLRPFDVAPLDACLRVPADPPGGQFKVSIMDRSDLRLDPATVQWAIGSPQGRGELKGWIDFADGRPIDPLALLFFLDALPPATFDIGRSGWVPTLSLTTYLRAAPAPGPLRVRQAAQVVADGRVDEVCELWDAEDRLVGQATQLAAIRFDDPVSLPTFPDASA